MAKSINSSIIEHLVDSNRVISPKETFSVLFSVHLNLNKGLSFRLFSTAEAIAVHVFNPLILSYANRSIFCVPYNYHDRK